jgi:hypothetical protein
MRLKLGPLVAKIDGSVGGMTFKRVSDGVVAQARSSYARTKRIRAVNQQQYLATLNRTWHALTSAQRNAWNAIRIASDQRSKKTKPPRYSSAEALFLSHNLPRLIYGLAAQTTAPTLAMTNAPFTEIGMITPATILAARFQLDPLLTGEYAFLQWTALQPRSHNSPRCWFTYRKLFTGPISTVVYTSLGFTVGANHCIWLELRRHSSSALTSRVTRQKLTYG